MADLAAGTVLDDRFVIRRLLGSGGFGTVYLADQKVFDLTLRQVALKLFHRDLVTGDNASEQLNDAAVVMRLQEEQSYPEATRHLITVLDAGILQGEGARAYIAMEYVTGHRMPGGATARTLADLSQAYRPVPVALALRWITQVLRAVAWMHTLDPPVLHCDLKADNVLADGPDRLKVADFGLAQVAFGSIGLWGGVGAITCQAPEVLAGVEPTPASDVYSLGLMLHEILAGRHPLTDVGMAELAADDSDGHRRRQLEARHAGIPRLTPDDNPDLVDHPLVGELVGRCLRFRATDRYPNAEVLLREIEAYTSGGALVPAAVEAPDGSEDLERLLAEVESFDGQHNPEKAFERAETALARFPEAVAAHLCIAKLRLKSGVWAEALKHCATGLRLPALTPAESAALLEVSAEAYDAGGNPSLAGKMRERARAARRGGRR
ncbi:serine/threonine-protein kinase [Saccharopolyspora sp. WRP15-2]|uniref:non-specific serine/threonine protein kinase n=1 Tax=Saccharopolyspora oryzae TaxID=2997343 RepID=A0ABT4V189_9PSEU|nr:serine/threonine-protein kinase [Saccharopolyspora oryzae]MDA3627092.1 serine/threonine-protein kinase [Saccharopolyspora oryzae]